MPADLVTAADTNEEHAKACRELVEKSGGKLYNAGTIHAVGLSSARRAAGVERDVPWAIGGTDWGGLSRPIRSSATCS